jgi:type VI secretion system secreted protein Hcp
MGLQIFVYFVGGNTPAEGETTDPFFRTVKAFEVQSFSFGIENPTSLGSASGGAGTGKAKFSEMTLLKKVDSASPALFRTCATGEHYTKMVLAVREGNNVYLINTFNLVFINKVRTVGNQGEAPLEEVSVAYGSQQVQYFPRRPDGTLGPGKETSWNQVTNSSDPGIPG